MTGWDRAAAGVLCLPSGRSIRGRGLRADLGEGLSPQFGLYLQTSAPPPTAWPARWVRWRDWALPADPDDLTAALREVWARAASERVEVACTGGRGRTGTALACLAILDGVPAADAVAFVRANYRRHAVETPAQRRFVRGYRG